MPTRRGPWRPFRWMNRDRYELKIAGLLHDCGKVTTPVHVVDKATKLQTLFDRIDLIDTRFEVLKRDQEIAVLRAQLEMRELKDPAAEATLWTACREKIDALDADREFLRHVNQGAEAMKDADLHRVRDIGQGTHLAQCERTGVRVFECR
jgi:hypothetical protein